MVKLNEIVDFSLQMLEDAVVFHSRKDRQAA